MTRKPLQFIGLFAVVSVVSVLSPFLPGALPPLIAASAQDADVPTPPAGDWHGTSREGTFHAGTDIPFQDDFSGDLNLWTLWGSPASYIDSGYGHPAPSLQINGDGTSPGRALATVGATPSPGTVISFDLQVSQVSGGHHWAGLGLPREWFASEAYSNWRAIAAIDSDTSAIHVGCAVVPLGDTRFHSVKAVVLSDYRLEMYLDDMVTPQCTTTGTFGPAEFNNVPVLIGGRGGRVDNVLVIAGPLDGTPTVAGRTSMWIAHQWMWEPDWGATNALAGELSSHGIGAVYVHVGSLDSSGAIDMSQYGSLPSNIVASIRSRGMSVIAWINGDTGVVDLTQGPVRTKTAALTAKLVDGSLGYYFDGVQLDLEPIPDPSQASVIYPAFKELLHTVRGGAGMGQDPILSVAAPPWESRDHAYIIGWDWFWQGDTYRDLALLGLVNQMVPMSYDVNPAGVGPVDYNGDAAIDGRDYADYLTDLTTDLLAKLAGTNAALSVGMPVYPAQPGMHLGNLADGLAGVSRCSTRSPGYHGISIYEIDTVGARYMDARAWYVLENAGRIPSGQAIIGTSTGTATATETIHQVLVGPVGTMELYVGWAGGGTGAAVAHGAGLLAPADCDLTLAVYRPDSSWHATYHTTAPAENIMISGPAPGTWEYRVTTTCPEPQDYAILTTRPKPSLYLPMVVRAGT